MSDEINLDEMVSSTYDPPQGVNSNFKHPDGWIPGIDTEKGQIVIATDIPQSDQGMIDWSGIVQSFGFDPDYFTVDGDRVNCRMWQANTGRGGVTVLRNEQGIARWERDPAEITWLYYYKADIVRKWRTPGDFDDLISTIRKRKALARPKPEGEATFLTFWADTQLGKRDEGGVKITVDNVMDCLGMAQDRYRQLKRTYNFGTLGIFGMGDLVEGCTGFYPYQEFQIELNDRDQLRVGTEVFTRVHAELADLASVVESGAVGGNHGENRKGKAMQYTEDADNKDLIIWDNIKRVLESNPDRYGHVKVQVPNSELWMQYQLGGVRFTITHGHVAGYSSSQAGVPYVKVWKWWEKHRAAKTPGLWDSRNLFAGHYHHRFVMDQTNHRLDGLPALESGSDYFRDRFGLWTPAGILTAVAIDGQIREYEVLSPGES